MATNRRRSDAATKQSDTQQPPGPVDRNEISRRAYQRYEERGREHGHDLDDWLEAERDVEGRSGEPN